MIWYDLLLSPFLSSLPSLALSRSCLGFTSKFDPYNGDEELLMSYNIDDDDDNINGNLFEIEETTTTIENLHLHHQQQMDAPDFEYLHFRNLTILIGNTAYLKVIFSTEILHKFSDNFVSVLCKKYRK